MNKKLILSLGLLAGVSQTSHAKITYGKLVLLSGVAATGLRTAWHLKNSKYNTSEQKFFDASLALGQDLGTIAENIGDRLKEGGVWLEENSRETRLNLPEFSEGSFFPHPFEALYNENKPKNSGNDNSNESEKPGYNAPVDDSQG